MTRRAANGLKAEILSVWAMNFAIRAVLTST
jgi:hypothetical protein